MEEIRIQTDDAGQRLDRFLRKYLRGATLPTLYKLVRTRQVTVNGRRSRPEKRLAEGDLVTIYPGEDRLRDLRGGARDPRATGALPIAVIYEDDDILAVAKPPLLLVHPGREDDGEPTLIDGVLDYLGPSGAKTFTPALAHRLDRQTSGVVLVGKTAAGLRGLTSALKKGELKKHYLALVAGVVESPRGRIDQPLHREALFKSDRPRVRPDRRLGKRAITDYRLLAARGGYSLLSVFPRTGRTHQIRVHLAVAGHPIAGDSTYGNRDDNARMKGHHGLWRQWLHAFEVRFAHPLTGRAIRIAAPLPDDLLRVLTGLRFPEDVLPHGSRVTS
jgi:23S rRNA pseudouridine955/2504/2580 synthase